MLQRRCTERRWGAPFEDRCSGRCGREKWGTSCPWFPLARCSGCLLPTSGPQNTPVASWCVCELRTEGCQGTACEDLGEALSAAATVNDKALRLGKWVTLRHQHRGQHGGSTGANCADNGGAWEAGRELASAALMPATMQDPSTGRARRKLC